MDSSIFLWIILFHYFLIRTLSAAEPLRPKTDIACYDCTYQTMKPNLGSVKDCGPEFESATLKIIRLRHTAQHAIESNRKLYQYCVSITVRLNGSVALLVRTGRLAPDGVQACVDEWKGIPKDYTEVMLIDPKVVKLCQNCITNLCNRSMSISFKLSLTYFISSIFAYVLFLN